MLLNKVQFLKIITQVIPSWDLPDQYHKTELIKKTILVMQSDIIPFLMQKYLYRYYLLSITRSWFRDLGPLNKFTEMSHQKGSYQ